jgi:hypothetical protein
VKRFQSLKVHLLDRIFRLRTAVQHRSGRSKNDVHVRQRLGIESGETSGSGPIAPASPGRSLESVSGAISASLLNWL